MFARNGAHAHRTLPHSIPLGFSGLCQKAHKYLWGCTYGLDVPLAIARLESPKSEFSRTAGNFRTASSPEPHCLSRTVDAQTPARHNAAGPQMVGESLGPVPAPQQLGRLPDADPQVETAHQRAYESPLRFLRPHRKPIYWTAAMSRIFSTVRILVVARATCAATLRHTPSIP